MVEDLYKECLNVTNMEHAADIPIELLKNDYKDFQQFTFRIGNYKSTLENAERRSYSYLLRFSIFIISYGVSYGVKYLAGNAAAQLLGEINLSGAIISKVGEILLPDHIEIVNKLAPFLNLTLKSSIVKIISGKINALVIEPATKPLMIFTYNSIESFVDLVTSYSRKKVILEDNLEFLASLSRLPPTIFSKFQKEKLNYLLQWDATQPADYYTPELKF